MIRCPRQNRQGKQCLKPAGVHLLHAYKQPGRRIPRPTAELFRRAVAAKADWVCDATWVADSDGRLICGTELVHDGAHAHHVIPRGRGGTDDPANGRWLCGISHKFVHSHPLEATALGLMRSAYGGDDA